MRRAAQLTEELGRLWEAWGWQIAILSVESGQPEATAARDRLRARLDREQPPWLLAGITPSEHVDLSAYPLPHFVAAVAKAPAATSSCRSRLRTRTTRNRAPTC